MRIPLLLALVPFIAGSGSAAFADEPSPGDPQAQAVDQLRELSRKNPADRRLLTRLGYALIAEGRHPEAVGVFDQLIAMDHASAGAYNGKAVAFDHAGNHVAAQDIYRQALALAPDSLAIHNNLALSLILNDEPQEASQMLERLAARKDATPTVRQNLALAYSLMGRKDRAMRVSEQDLTARQAETNVKFYERYARLRKEKKRGAPEPEIDANGAQETVTLDRLAPAAGENTPAAAGHADRGEDAPPAFGGDFGTRDWPDRAR